MKMFAQQLLQQMLRKQRKQDGIFGEQNMEMIMNGLKLMRYAIPNPNSTKAYMYAQTGIRFANTSYIT